jgi:RNA polymerase-binding transcription factor DksA
MRASIVKEIRNLKQELLWNHSEEKLLQERRKIANAIAKNLRLTHDLDEGWQERDSPSEEEIREVEFSHREHLHSTLRHIDEALERLANQSFGRCIECRRLIEKKRLQADPTVGRCLACQSALEGNHRMPTL